MGKGICILFVFNLTHFGLQEAWQASENYMDEQRSAAHRRHVEAFLENNADSLDLAAQVVPSPMTTPVQR